MAAEHLVELTPGNFEPTLLITSSTKLNAQTSSAHHEPRANIKDLIELEV